ncbi:hypothetical protein RQP46_002784 [Phenoliferia psychrophenolica]
MPKARRISCMDTSPPARPPAAVPTRVPAIPPEVLLRIFHLASEPPTDWQGINDRHTTLRNLSLVSRAFHGCAQAVLYQSLALIFIPSTVEPLLHRLRNTSELAHLTTQITATYYHRELWKYERAKHRAAARLEEAAPPRRGFSPRPHEKEKAFRQERITAENEWDESIEGDWDAAAQDDEMHGALAAVLSLASVAPRLRSLTLDEFDVPFARGPTFSSEFTALRSLTLGSPNFPKHRPRGFDRRAFARRMSPDFVAALLRLTPNLTHLEIPSESTFLFTIPPLPLLTSLHIANCTLPSPALLDPAFLPPLTSLSLIPISGGTLRDWLPFIAKFTTLTTLRIKAYAAFEDGAEADPFRDYLESSSLTSLSVPLNSTDTLRLLPSPLPPTLKTLQLEFANSRTADTPDSVRASLVRVLEHVKDQSEGLTVELSAGLYKVMLDLEGLVTLFEEAGLRLTFGERDVDRPVPPMPGA